MIRQLENENVIEKCQRKMSAVLNALVRGMDVKGRQLVRDIKWIET